MHDLCEYCHDEIDLNECSSLRITQIYTTILPDGKNIMTTVDYVFHSWDCLDKWRHKIKWDASTESIRKHLTNQSFEKDFQNIP